MRLRFTPEAEADLDDTHGWYEDQRVGLGDEFIRIVDAAIASIRRNPAGYQLVDETMRRALLRRFPYAVFFEVIAPEIVVYGVLHCARDPMAWKRRRGA